MPKKCKLSLGELLLLVGLVGVFVGLNARPRPGRFILPVKGTPLMDEEVRVYGWPFRAYVAAYDGAFDVLYYANAGYNATIAVVTIVSLFCLYRHLRTGGD